MNLFKSGILDDFPVDDLWKRNPFKGDINIELLEAFLEEHKGRGACLSLCLSLRLCCVCV